MALSREHGTYKNSEDRKWHTIGEMDLLVEIRELERGK